MTRRCEMVKKQRPKDSINPVEPLKSDEVHGVTKIVQAKETRGKGGKAKRGKGLRGGS